jgi:hypothetical protein
MSEPNPEPAVEPPPEPAPEPAPEPSPEPAPKAAAEPAPTPEPKPNGKEPDPEPAPSWPEDWREKIAEHASAGDKKAFDKAMRSLKRYDSPALIFSKARELESVFSDGNLIKKPGKDASEDDVKAFRKALEVPDEPKGYLEHIKLANGAVIGDFDKPIVEYFAEAAHRGGMQPAAFNELINAYYARDEELAAELDQADENFMRESMAALKEEYGAKVPRYQAAAESLFAMYAPGGNDKDNPESLLSQVRSARLPNGRLLGDDPKWNKFFFSLANEINPAVTVTEGGDQTGKGVEAELAEIRKVMRDDRRRYNKDPNMQKRFSELLDAQQKIQARA